MSEKQMGFCLRYFGCDITKLFDRKIKNDEDVYEV
jgi:hypothetical protein